MRFHDYCISKAAMMDSIAFHRRLYEERRRVENFMIQTLMKVNGLI